MGSFGGLFFKSKGTIPPAAWKRYGGRLARCQMASVGGLSLGGPTRFVGPD